MPRVYNFSAGPAVLPEEVLSQAAAEMLDYHGCGMSVMEMSHRSPVFQGILDEAEADLRQLMGVPDDYAVLFLQGGDSLLFSTVFMNLAKNGKADYVVSGNWSKKAFEQALILGDPKLLASSEDGNFSYVPDVGSLDVRDDASFVYICQNETITGTRFPELPDTKGWWQTRARCFSPSRLMWAPTGSSTQACRRTWGRPASRWSSSAATS